MKDFYGGTNKIVAWKQEFSTVKPAKVPEWIPLTSHWCVTGANGAGEGVAGEGVEDKPAHGSVAFSRAAHTATLTNLLFV